jgi:hypothetical protein
MKKKRASLHNLKMSKSCLHRNMEVLSRPRKATKVPNQMKKKVKNQALSTRKELTLNCLRYWTKKLRKRKKRFSKKVSDPGVEVTTCCLRKLALSLDGKTIPKSPLQLESPKMKLNCMLRPFGVIKESKESRRCVADDCD